MDTTLKLDFAVNAPENEIPRSFKAFMNKSCSVPTMSSAMPRPERISTPKHHYFLFRHGQSVVDSLLRDPEFETVYRFELLGQPFVALKNLRRSVAARPGKDDPPSSASGTGIPGDMDIFC